MTTLRKKHTLPNGTSWEKRAIALAKRLGIDLPPSTAMWARIGKTLLPIEPPFTAETLTLNQLWAEIGMFLAEGKHPEFQWAPGRPKGSVATYPPSSKKAAKKRMQRARRRQRERLSRAGWTLINN
jgi:hypothetical protein